MAKILYGKDINKNCKEKIRYIVKSRISRGLSIPCMATVLVGNDGGSIFYARNQKRVCEELGVKNLSINLNESITESELIKEIEKLNNDKNIHGIILLLPLPKHINEKNVTSKISPAKDIDGLTDVNFGKFYKGEESFVPCTPRAIIEVIKSTRIDINGKNAVVVGRSNIVGKPVAQLLLNQNATVTICHSKTKNLKQICSNADILVVAIGKPSEITEEYIKENAIVIDVGTTMVNKKIKGDIKFNEETTKAGFITPVPKGIGSVTTTMLILNVCEASERNVY